MAGQPVPTTASPVSAPPTTPTTVAPERLTSASRVRLDGIGPVRVGMTPEEASAAAGIPIRIDPRSGLGRGCAHARPEGGPERLSFMVVNGRIERVEVGNPDILTLSGVGVGSTEAEVLATYPNRIRVEPNPYIGHLGGRDLTYMPDETSRHLSLLLTTDGKRVTSFRAGLLGAVMAPEGCS